MTLNEYHDAFLSDSVKGKWILNPDTGMVDVEGDFTLYHNMDSLPISFGKVTGYFHCYHNNLKTLKGSPYWVGGDYNCSGNPLTSLKYAPKYIGGQAIVWNNVNLEAIEWTPEYVNILYFSLKQIRETYWDIVIPDLQCILDRGIEINLPETYYHPYVNSYYERRFIEVL